MSLLRLGTFALASLAVLATGCQNKLHDENMSLHDQNNKLQAELTDARSKLADAESRLQKAPDPASLSQMQQRINELEAQLKATPASAAGGAASADPNLAGIEATYDKARGTLTVNLPGEVLFDVGKATLKPSAGATLDKIASAIKKDYGSKTVYVDGHTDAKPIVKTKDQWSDNWDLGAARANAVRNYLVGKGVDSKKLNLRSFGPNKPKATDNASRRVEIVVQVN